MARREVEGDGPRGDPNGPTGRPGEHPTDGSGLTAFPLTRARDPRPMGLQESRGRARTMRSMLFWEIPGNGAIMAAAPTGTHGRRQAPRQRSVAGTVLITGR
jgi:hypothetical protein